MRDGYIYLKWDQVMKDKIILGHHWTQLIVVVDEKYIFLMSVMI